MGLTHPLHNGYRTFLEGKAARGVALTIPSFSSAVVQERVELYIYSPSGPSWPVLLYFLLFTLLIWRFSTFVKSMKKGLWAAAV
jgi:hypothetical protein